MSERKMFDGVDAGTRRFYSKIVGTAMLNIYAVEHALFDTLLCESDDPASMARWQQAEPLILDAIRHRADDDPDHDYSWMDF